jgi:hypothetical protein
MPVPKNEALGRDAFAADLIRAIEDAQRASQAPKSRAALAAAAHATLQYDFPVRGA